jgi:cytidine deaminase
MDKERLIASARTARGQAFAPYSKYAVGAAVADASGHIWTGCNVENASYGATVCAERVAIFKMVSEGRRDVRVLAISASNIAPPCGICLQVLSEFATEQDSLMIYLSDSEGLVEEFTMSQLLPHPFKL